MRRRALIACLLVPALAGCGSSDDGGSAGQASTPASTAAAGPPGAQALVACLEKAGMKVEGSGDTLKASGNGDVVEIHLFSSATESDAFAKKQTADSTQAGNRVAVYGAGPKPNTVDAVESCLPGS